MMRNTILIATGFMLVGVCAVLAADAAVGSVAQATETPAPAAAVRETLILRGGAQVTGEILREKTEGLVIDLGFTVLTVPADEIVRRFKEGIDQTEETARAEGQLFEEAAADRKQQPVKELVEQLDAAVVLVTTPGGLGSGFVVDERGYLVTNAHVIEGEREISITLFRKHEGMLDRIKIDDVKIVAVNPFVDLALLKVEPPDGIMLTRVLLGHAQAVREGQGVFAIGNPLGLERTVSEGIVSTARRSFGGQIFIQTTAPINPGNSGGPLFSLQGAVVGITNMKAGFFTEGLSFAIPVNVLKEFLRNRDVFAFDKDNPNTGYHYLTPPRKPEKDG